MACVELTPMRPDLAAYSPGTPCQGAWYENPRSATRQRGGLRRATKTGRSTDRSLGRQYWVAPITPMTARDARAYRYARLDRRQGPALRPPV